MSTNCQLGGSKHLVRASYPENGSLAVVTQTEVTSALREGPEQGSYFRWSIAERGASNMGCGIFVSTSCQLSELARPVAFQGYREQLLDILPEIWILPSHGPLMDLEFLHLRSRRQSLLVQYPADFGSSVTSL